MTITERIRFIRTFYKLTQKEFAVIAEVSQGNISEMEKGTFKPSVDTVISVCEYFSLSADWLLMGRGCGPGEQSSPAGSADQQDNGNNKKIEAVFDPDLKLMIDTLKLLMESGDPDLRGWAKIQFKKAFGEQTATVEKKQHA